MDVSLFEDDTGKVWLKIWSTDPMVKDAFPDAVKHHDAWLVETRRFNDVKRIAMEMPLDIFSETKSILPSNWESLVPSKTLDAAFPYQIETSKRILDEFGGRVVLSTFTGSGKSLIVSVVFSILKRVGRRFLIVAPSGLRQNFKIELIKWSSFREDDIRVIDKGTDSLGTESIVIMSYHIATAKIKELYGVKFHAIAMDEAHALKTPGSSRSKCIIPLARSIPVAIPMTATAILNRHMEFLSMLRIVHKDKVKLTKGVEYAFGNRYCDGKVDVFGHWKAVGCTNHEEMHILVKRTMIRITKTQVDTGLPGMSKTIHHLFTDVQTLEGLTRKLKKIWTSTKEKQNKNEFLRVFSEIMKVTMESKIDPFISFFIDFVNESPSRCVVFVHHKRFGRAIKEALDNAGIHSVTINGGINPKKRQAIVDEFVYNMNIRVAILGIESASEGLNIVPHRGIGKSYIPINNVVFAETGFVPAKITQAIARVWRKGATHDVKVIFTLLNGSIEESIHRKLESKSKHIESTIDNNEIETFFAGI